MKLDVLAIGAHPDDIELSCSGTLLKHIAMGKKCGVLDLTQGELGTRGSAELRMKESAAASKILALSVRENLKMADGFFKNDEAHQKKIIEIIRKYQPEIILCNAVADRHPDHGRAAALVKESAFYSGLMRIETQVDGAKQDAWRPKAVYHYVQDQQLKADFVVDVTAFVDKKMEAIQAFKSQFFDAKSTEPVSPISVENFLDVIKGRMAVYGRDISVDFAEAYTVDRSIGVDNLFDIR